jgi:hypothetical protein
MEQPKLKPKAVVNFEVEKVDEDEPKKGVDPFAKKDDVA